MGGGVITALQQETCVQGIPEPERATLSPAILGRFMPFSSLKRLSYCRAASARLSSRLCRCGRAGGSKLFLSRLISKTVWRNYSNPRAQGERQELKGTGGKDEDDGINKEERLAPQESSRRLSQLWLEKDRRKRLERLLPPLWYVMHGVFCKGGFCRFLACQGTNRHGRCHLPRIDEFTRIPHTSLNLEDFQCF